MSFSIPRFLTILAMTLLISIPAFAQSKAHVRHSRYCEVLLSQTGLSFKVYNTLGLNDCPDNLWSNLTVAQVKKDTHANFAILNGPRYFMMDSMINIPTINPEVHVFNNLTTREVAVVRLGLIDLLTLGKPYREHQVDRQTTWIYDADKPIYELIDPKGRVFVLQSYSLQKTPQTVASLSTLGSNLKLPKGWRFRTGLLKEPAEVIAIDSKAIVIQDDLLNTYQLATKDFLE